MALMNTWILNTSLATRSLENNLRGDLHRVRFSSRFNF